uniref:B30.2/SPRY domain-containing protein n=1 Tax=Astatotilapia calliptera TaxID=8154 RepID=A0A3P8PIA1_ASTCA
MSAASNLRSEDQFLCSICLDVFTAPVTTPCGHNFCKTCISQHWDMNVISQQKASSSSSEQQAAKPGEPHLTVKRLKRHQLIDALFCKTDQTCVCVLCSVLDHKNHEFVPLREEYEGKKAELEKTEAEIQQMIQKRRLKIQEITESVKMSKDAADRQKAEGVQVLTALMESVERRLKKLMKEIEDKQEATEKQAEGLIKDLEQEISELMERSSEVEQLSRSEDHLHLLQSFSSLKAAPPSKDWTEVRVHPPSYEGTVGRAVAQLEETVWKPMKKKLFEAELQRVQQDEVDVTLDPDTAHPDLILSDNGKQVYDTDVEKNLPDNPERFSQCPGVLGEQSFSSGRFYFEVQVKGKTEWELGVATESINRKGIIRASPQDGFWTVGLVNGNEYIAGASPLVPLCLHPGPEKVGVFVDYEEGLVSFYDVGAAALIYSFNGCSFTHKLHPFFCPCPNDGEIHASMFSTCRCGGERWSTDCCILPVTSF